MKTILVILTVSLCGYVLAEEGNPIESLDTIKERHDADLVDALVPIHHQYLRSLVRLQQSHVTAGDLDSALRVREAIQRAEAWTDFPVSQLKDSFERFRKKLDGMRAAFEGRCGPVRLRFYTQYVLYTHEDQTWKVPYSITGYDSLTIHRGSGGYDVNLSADLQSGSLRSELGVYPLKIFEKDRPEEQAANHKATNAVPRQ